MASAWLRGDAINAAASGRGGMTVCICYLTCRWIMMGKQAGSPRAVSSISWRMILMSFWGDTKQISVLLIDETGGERCQ